MAILPSINSIGDEFKGKYGMHFWTFGENTEFSWWDRIAALTLNFYATVHSQNWTTALYYTYIMVAKTKRPPKLTILS